MASNRRGSRRPSPRHKEIDPIGSNSIALALTEVKVNTQTDGTEMRTVTAMPVHGDGVPSEISYIQEKILATGAFGDVYLAKLLDKEAQVVIKKQRQEKKIKNRELEIFLEVKHCNIVNLLYYFHTKLEDSGEIILNLVLEHMSSTLNHLLRSLEAEKKILSLAWIRIYAYQLFRALGYIHARKICHRDIKPDNLLVNPTCGVLKVCDFGTAAHIVPGEPRMCYVASRYYRAPELIFGATNYGAKIDIWSGACVIGEMFMGRPLFVGSNNLEQTIEMIKVLGTPTPEEITAMNPDYQQQELVSIEQMPLQQLLPEYASLRALKLLEKLLRWSPNERPTGLQVCADEFFDELRLPNARLSNGEALPPLFNFCALELAEEPQLEVKLTPI